MLHDRLTNAESPIDGLTRVEARKAARKRRKAAQHAKRQRSIDEDSFVGSRENRRRIYDAESRQAITELIRELSRDDSTTLIGRGKYHVKHARVSVVTGQDGKAYAFKATRISVERKQAPLNPQIVAGGVLILYVGESRGNHLRLANAGFTYAGMLKASNGKRKPAWMAEIAEIDTSRLNPLFPELKELLP